MRKFSISDIEAITGIKAHTIRIWEQRYAFVVPKRTETNIRYYDDKDLCFFLNISNLSENGYKISEISKMSAEEMVSAVSLLSADSCNPCVHVNALTDSTLLFNEAKFLSTLAFCIEAKGLEKTMQETIFPFMRKMGVMWQTGVITPAHEHFSTDLIKRKLICTIDALPNCDDFQAKRFLLFLPSLETHELGLLFAHYIVKSYGHQVLYLGQSIPYEDLDVVSQAYQPDFCITCLTSVLIDNDVNNVIDKIVENLHGQKLVVSGPLILSSNVHPRKNMFILKNLIEFSEFVSSRIVAHEYK